MNPADVLLLENLKKAHDLQQRALNKRNRENQELREENARLKRDFDRIAEIVRNSGSSNLLEAENKKLKEEVADLREQIKELKQHFQSVTVQNKQEREFRYDQISKLEFETKSLREKLAKS